MTNNLRYFGTVQFRYKIRRNYALAGSRYGLSIDTAIGDWNGRKQRGDRVALFRRKWYKFQSSQSRQTD